MKTKFFILITTLSLLSTPLSSSIHEIQKEVEALKHELLSLEEQKLSNTDKFYTPLFKIMIQHLQAKVTKSIRKTQSKINELQAELDSIDSGEFDSDYTWWTNPEDLKDYQENVKRRNTEKLVDLLENLIYYKELRKELENWAASL